MKWRDGGWRNMGGLLCSSEREGRRELVNDCHFPSRDKQIWHLHISCLSLCPLLWLHTAWQPFKKNYFATLTPCSLPLCTISHSSAVFFLFFPPQISETNLPFRHETHKKDVKTIATRMKCFFEQSSSRLSKALWREKRRKTSRYIEKKYKGFKKLLYKWLKVGVRVERWNTGLEGCMDWWRRCVVSLQMWEPSLHFLPIMYSEHTQ